MAERLMKSVQILLFCKVKYCRVLSPSAALIVIAADGMRCKNLNYYLKCVPADHYVGYYDEVCNEDPVEDSSCGRSVETRKPDCVAFDDISEAVFDHTETKCHTNEDCDPGVDCLVFGDTFCLCDQEKHFTSVYPSICNTVDTSREGDDESTIDTTTSENENTEENSTSTLPCVNPLSLLSPNDKNKIAFEHVSSNCRSSRDCDEGVECRVFGDNVFTACDQYNDFEGDFPIICHHDAP
eukprot:CAMPEP_0194200862 /NCGR_PEP_ID=MMETSP0156-20130528/1309_1 /TAXON_ID=33649 /ORGANISM="Thalassionema nitzschioides, Strain L26-B" /LENGTH=238 /DNA_ID=CAMNT_0038925927 /DNA_START=153 /DNA_END=868 /DNA_ORIENTATION=+